MQVAPKTTNQPTIRAFFLQPVAAELSSLGLDLDGLLRAHGLPARGSGTLYDRLFLRRFVAFAESAAERLKRPSLWFDLGARFDVTCLGPFYLLLASAKSLRSALDCFARLHSTWQTDTAMEAVRREGTTTYVYAIADPTIWPRRQDAEFTMASLTSLMRQLSSPRLSPLEVRFEHPVDDHHRDLLKQFFRSPVSGNDAVNALVMRDEDLDRPSHGLLGLGSDRLMPILERHLCDLLANEEALEQNLVEKTKALVGKRLGRAPVDLATVAAELGHPERSLRRKLAQAGTSYRDILEGQRALKARTVLEDGDIPLASLARRLGYSNAAVLSRAFRGWTGLSPRQYARQRRLDVGGGTNA